MDFHCFSFEVRSLVHWDNLAAISKPCKAVRPNYPIKHKLGRWTSIVCNFRSGLSYIGTTEVQLENPVAHFAGMILTSTNSEDGRILFLICRSGLSDIGTTDVQFDNHVSPFALISLSSTNSEDGLPFFKGARQVSRP